MPQPSVWLIREQVQKRNRQFRVLLQQIRDLKEDIQHDDNDANGKADDDKEPVGVMDVVEDEDDSELVC